jgi:hypothetical protein
VRWQAIQYYGESISAAVAQTQELLSPDALQLESAIEQYCALQNVHGVHLDYNSRDIYVHIPGMIATNPDLWFTLTLTGPVGGKPTPPTEHVPPWDNTKLINPASAKQGMSVKIPAAVLTGTDLSGASGAAEQDTGVIRDLLAGGSAGGVGQMFANGGGAAGSDRSALIRSQPVKSIGPLAGGAVTAAIASGNQSQGPAFDLSWLFNVDSWAGEGTGLPPLDAVNPQPLPPHS